MFEAANGDEGIGMEEIGREGDMGVSEGDEPRGRLYGSNRSSGWAEFISHGLGHAVSSKTDLFFCLDASKRSLLMTLYTA